VAWIEGRNPIREALRAGRPIRRLLIASGASGIADILDAARAARVRVERVPRAALDGKASTNAHQGVLAETDDFVYRSWRDGVSAARERGEPALLLALDGVTDPHNLGSLIRSAESAGAHAVIIPARRSAHVNATVEKAAAGATAHVVVDRVTNLERALRDVRDEGIWVVALDPEGVTSVFEEQLLAENVAIVVGAEGPGVSRLIAERADARVRIPLAGKTASLNAGVAGAIALFEARRRRGAAP
jgi:23S rRNA (guanosine2251-2'-O)-methyltransferase